MPSSSALPDDEIAARNDHNLLFNESCAFIPLSIVSHVRRAIAIGRLSHFSFRAPKHFVPRLKNHKGDAVQIFYDRAASGKL
jgi:hypothetical protein